MSDRAPIWQFDADAAQHDSYNDWWEGNVGIGFDGTLYAGNTNFNYYAVDAQGALDWVYETGANDVRPSRGSAMMGRCSGAATTPSFAP